MNMVRKVVGYRRFRAWSANPKRNPGRRPEWERVREEEREDSSYDYLILRVHKKKKKDIARLVRPPFVTTFFHADSFLALGLAYELASISRESCGVPCDHFYARIYSCGSSTLSRRIIRPSGSHQKKLILINSSFLSNNFPSPIDTHIFSKKTE